jgi:hypothetical protein
MKTSYLESQGTKSLQSCQSWEPYPLLCHQCLAFAMLLNLELLQMSWVVT